MGIQDKKCQNCGETFVTNRVYQKFCSPECYQLHLRKGMNKIRKRGKD